MEKAIPTLTIYTPTYNRGHLLTRVYESLCQQTCKDFEWLVIDDGSTDETRKIVNEWMRENKISITYLYKENGGVHTARDLAFRSCKTELITSCDSDDWLTSDAVEEWLKCWNNRGEGTFYGIFMVVETEDGKRITKNFPKVQSATYQEFAYKYNCTDDKHSLFRTDVVAALPPFPVFEGEKLVGEGYKWIQLPEDGKFILMDKVTYICERQETGYVRSASESRFLNPNGFRALRKQLIINGKYLKPKLRGHSGYVAYSIILKDREFLKNSPEPFLTFLMLPIGLAEYLYYVFKRGKR